MAGLLYQVGFWIRETGQALDRVGCRLQNNKAFVEELWRHRPVMNLSTRKPDVQPSAFVAPSASVIGQVTLGKNSSVWYGCVLRGDMGHISVGENSNLQDGTVVRTVATYLASRPAGTHIGKNVTVGHFATLNGCTIEDESLIGMGATLLEGVRVEKNAMVAAGAVVQPQTVVPSGEVWGGNPARFLRALKPEEKSFMVTSADKYAALAGEHKQETEKPLLQSVAGRHS
uniref:Gamma type carbonic anhydrase n=1 Tax=Lobosphaera incisa TaxID=312850 RepID=A0A0D5CNI8_9CHLO|nr:gamma type carbonic anhydrase [Lobosphaera incisa]